MPNHSRQSRVPSIDALRGLVMIIMALDHVREFFHSGAMQFQPEDLARTNAAIFLTRWITHFCAPVFMFTAGVSAFAWWNSRGRGPMSLSVRLWTRGLWLIVLDLVVIRLALNFSLTSGFMILNVLWALGWSMIVLGFLAHLPLRVLATLSVATIALHNLLDPIAASSFGSAGWLWNIIHQPGVFPAAGALVLAAYPVVPWFAVMSAGFCFGWILLREPADRRRWFLAAGAILTIAFLILRGVNIYGDPSPWSVQPTVSMTALSFLRTTKYPPSLAFLLMTLGPALLLLGWLERRNMAASNPLIVFGRVPLFYFVVHLFVAHALTFPLALLKYGHVSFLWNVTPSLGGDPKLYPPGYGYDLWITYVLWLAVVVMLYPVCLWFGRLKQRSKSRWLSYL